MKAKYTINTQAENMVMTQCKQRGIKDTRVLEVLSILPRHLFISGKSRDVAYGDYPVPIGHDQTISQPYIVAYMTQSLELRGDERVLEIGTGSGYQTALLAEMAREVYTVEIIPSLQKQAKKMLSALGYKNIYYRLGDGKDGWAEFAPFDRIIVTAAAATIPFALKTQLNDNCLMVIPVGDYREVQELQVLRKVGEDFIKEESIGCRFVPLVDKGNI